jgi:hypothetical protein
MRSKQANSNFKLTAINTALLVNEGQLKSRKKLILISSSGSLVVFLILAIVHQEPFAPRYKGKTVDQWLAFYAHESVERDETFTATEDVVKGFETNALTVLTRNSKPPYLLKKAIDQEVNINKVLGKRLAVVLIWKPLSASAYRETIARIWRHDILLRSGALIDSENAEK